MLILKINFKKLFMWGYLPTYPSSLKDYKIHGIRDRYKLLE
jgi:hypothetical protein